MQECVGHPRNCLEQGRDVLQWRYYRPGGCLEMTVNEVIRRQRQDYLPRGLYRRRIQTEPQIPEDRFHHVDEAAISAVEMNCQNAVAAQAAAESFHSRSRISHMMQHPSRHNEVEVPL